MATTVLVDRDLDVGRRILGALAKARIAVGVAFWAYAPQVNEWQFFIATSLVDSAGPKSAYEQVLRTLHLAGMDPELPWRRIFLRSPKDPVLKSLEKQSKNYSGSIDIMESDNLPRGNPSAYYVTYAPHSGEMFKALNLPIGDRFIEDAYVYGSTWLVTGLDHLRELLLKLHVNNEAVGSAIKELSGKKRASIPNIQLRPRDLRRLSPA
jgi:hypothetical protein